MTNKRTISVQRRSGEQMNMKRNNFHYFREEGNTVAPVSIMFLFHLYNNTELKKHSSTKISEFKYNTMINSISTTITRK